MKEIATFAEACTPSVAAINSGDPTHRLLEAADSPTYIVPLEEVGTELECIPVVAHDGIDDRALLTSSHMTNDELSEMDDDLNPARGLINGVVLALPHWGGVGLLIWYVLCR